MFYVLFMYKCVLPPGVNPIAVGKYININISISISVHLHVLTQTCFSKAHVVSRMSGCCGDAVANLGFGFNNSGGETKRKKKTI
jgi:hypothetical protein